MAWPATKWKVCMSTFAYHELEHLMIVYISILLFAGKDLLMANQIFKSSVTLVVDAKVFIHGCQF